MKKILSSLLLVFLSISAPAAQNPRHYGNSYGACSSCDCMPCACPPQAGNLCPPVYGSPPCPPPCAPCQPGCAPVCGTDCGLTICGIGVAVLAVIAAAVIVITSGQGVHQHG